MRCSARPAELCRSADGGLAARLHAARARPDGERGLRNAIRRAASANVIAKIPGARVPANTCSTSRTGTISAARCCAGPMRSSTVRRTMRPARRACCRWRRRSCAAPRRRSGPSCSSSPTAEEAGLLGSAYYVDHPVVPLAATVAALNMDTLHFGGPRRDVSVVGWRRLRARRTRSTLAARRQGRVLVPEPTPQDGMYFRSDHFNFAKAGVPGLYFKLGIDDRERGAAWGQAQRDEYYARRYHKSADRYLPGTDLRGGLEDLQLMYAVGDSLANGRTFPRWSPESEFRGRVSAAWPRPASRASLNRGSDGGGKPRTGRRGPGGAGSRLRRARRCPAERGAAAAPATSPGTGPPARASRRVTPRRGRAGSRRAARRSRRWRRARARRVPATQTSSGISSSPSSSAEQRQRELALRPAEGARVSSSFAGSNGHAGIISHERGHPDSRDRGRLPRPLPRPEICPAARQPAGGGRRRARAGAKCRRGGARHAGRGRPPRTARQGRRRQHRHDDTGAFRDRPRVPRCRRRTCWSRSRSPKPSTQARELVDLARRRGRVLQVGHLERFNAAVLAAETHLAEPRFIECQRLAPFKERGTDVNVVLDLMIHDIDIVQTIVGSADRHDRCRGHAGVLRRRRHRQRAPALHQRLRGERHGEPGQPEDRTQDARVPRRRLCLDRPAAEDPDRDPQARRRRRPPASCRSRSRSRASSRATH